MKKRKGGPGAALEGARREPHQDRAGAAERAGRHRRVRREHQDAAALRARGPPGARAGHRERDRLPQPRVAARWGDSTWNPRDLSPKKTNWTPIFESGRIFDFWVGENSTHFRTIFKMHAHHSSFLWPDGTASQPLPTTHHRGGHHPAGTMPADAAMVQTTHDAAEAAMVQTTQAAAVEELVLIVGRMGELERSWVACSNRIAHLVRLHPVLAHLVSGPSLTSPSTPPPSPSPPSPPSSPTAPQGRPFKKVCHRPPRATLYDKYTISELSKVWHLPQRDAAHACGVR